MKLYVVKNGARREKLEAGEVPLHDFENNAKSEWTKGNTNLGWVDLKDLAGWYKEESDEKLVSYVSSGNKEALENYISTHPQGEEQAKEYLKNIRFDSDGMATQNYRDFSGWNLLNAAAYAGQAEMTRFLVDTIGMDINTPSYGVVPTYCCFPSMHNHTETNNFSSENLETAKVFIEKGGDLSCQCCAHRPGVAPSGLAIIHVASLIKDNDLRQEALDLITEKMRENNPDCNITDSAGRNALHHLLSLKGKNFSELEPQVRTLIVSGVNPIQESLRGRKPIDCLDNAASKVLFTTLLEKLRPGLASVRSIV